MAISHFKSDIKSRGYLLITGMDNKASLLKTLTFDSRAYLQNFISFNYQLMINCVIYFGEKFDVITEGIR